MIASIITIDVAVVVVSFFTAALLVAVIVFLSIVVTVAFEIVDLDDV